MKTPELESDILRAASDRSYPDSHSMRHWNEVGKRHAQKMDLTRWVPFCVEGSTANAIACAIEASEMAVGATDMLGNSHGRRHVGAIKEGVKMGVYARLIGVK